jgi:hypothetical protein
MRMLWLVVVVLGLVTETWVIVRMGRQVTRRFEEEEGLAAPEVGLPAPRRLHRDAPAPRRARPTDVPGVIGVTRVEVVPPSGHHDRGAHA